VCACQYLTKVLTSHILLLRDGSVSSSSTNTGVIDEKMQIALNEF